MLKESPEYLDQLGIDSDSEAALLHAIHELGIRAIKDRIAGIGYELLARQLADQNPSEAAARKARRNRQAASWGDE